MILFLPVVCSLVLIEYFVNDVVQFPGVDTTLHVFLYTQTHRSALNLTLHVRTTASACVLMMHM